MRLSAIALTLAVGASVPAMAANLVTNGGFETNGGNGQVNSNTTIAGWSLPNPNDSYSFLYAPGTADTTGAMGEYGNLILWGPGSGSANGLPAASPAGGFFMAIDPAFQNNGPLSQTISGLVPGSKYTVSFYWAAAQQAGFDGATSDFFQVSLGADTFTTTTESIPDKGFSGWQQASFTTTASAASEVLSFLAQGGPQLPPFALLDGISVNNAPEPASFALLGVGLVGLGVYRVRRRR